MPALSTDHRTMTVTQDQMGRTVVVIPDTDVRDLQAEVTRGWTELYGVADGYSREFLPGTWAYDMTRAILAAVAERAEDERDRREAGGPDPRAIVFVCGTSGWDADARWWADYDRTKDLHVSGYPSKVRGKDAYEFTG